MGSYIGYLVVAAVIWQIIGALLEKSAAKRHKLRQQQARLEEQRRASGGANMSTPQPTDRSSMETVATSQPTARRGGATTRAADDLAARQRAQLEELRRRRQQKSSAGPKNVPPVRNAPASSPRPESPYDQTTRSGAAARSAPTPSPVPHGGIGGATAPRTGGTGPVGANSPERIRQERMEHARRIEELRWKQEQNIRLEEQQRLAAEAAQRLRQRKATDEQRKALAAKAAKHAASTEMASIGSLATTEGLVAALQDPETLRRLFILKEILDPPISMRQNQLASDQ